MTDNRPWSERFRLVAKEWVDADAAASLLEDTKSAFLAQKITEQGAMPHNRAEASVKSSDEWVDYVTRMIEARRKANLSKMHLEYLRMRFSEEQSANATRRAEMKLG